MATTASTPAGHDARLDDARRYRNKAAHSTQHAVLAPALARAFIAAAREAIAALYPDDTPDHQQQ